MSNGVKRCSTLWLDEDCINIKRHIVSSGALTYWVMNLS